MKKLVELHNKNKNISHIEFDVISDNEIVQQSHVHIYNNNIYDDCKNPTDNGLMDYKMGPLDNNKCKVCDEDRKSCMGHYGYINLNNYLFPISFLKDIVKILKCICKTCGCILLTTDQLKNYDKCLRKRDLNYIMKKSIRRDIIKHTLKVKECRFCKSSNGMVKKVKALSMIYHKKYDTKGSLQEFVKRFEHIPENLQSLTNNGIELLRPHYVFNLFRRVPRKYYKYLGVGPNMDLSNLIFKHLTVPPNCIRPSTLTNDINTSREDDITIVMRTLLGDLKLPAAHNEYTSMIKPSAANLRIKDNKFIRGIMQRLAGKKGRFRNNLMGKRTNYTSRTVISPDPYLRIDQVSIPEYCALKLTFTDKVTAFNIEHLRTLVLNGPFIHPGAIAYAELGEPLSQQAMSHMKLINNHLKWITLRSPMKRKEISATMKIGDLVERHIDCGDLVLFNRQPSLHRLSFQSFSVVVHKERTMSFNPCCCHPFNADFDGDEMNVHFPQTYEAQAECQVLISSTRNIGSPNRGEPLTSPLQDILTAAYLLTSKDSFYTRAQFLHLALRIFTGLDRVSKRVHLPRPAIWRPVVLYTGKQLMGVILAPYRRAGHAPQARINVVAENRVYRCGEDTTADDSYVVIHNSDHVLGQLDKALLGSGSKSSVFYRLLRDVGHEESCRAMERLCQVALTDLKYRGFSIGISDVAPSGALTAAKNVLIEAKFKDCDRIMGDEINCDPGLSVEETREVRISGVLSAIRDDGGRQCRQELRASNPALVMAVCGSKGSQINISQMVFCVGQQIIGNKRIEHVPGTGRTLLFWPRGSRSPMARGFVANSFYSGLTPAEFLFHGMSGREGLIDTAVKTAETGYMQRRLIKCLEDLAIQYDGTVRDFRGTLVQYRYGGDGFDPAMLETSDRPCDLIQELYHALQYCGGPSSGALVGRGPVVAALEEILREYDEDRRSFPGLKMSLRETVQRHLACAVGLKYGISRTQLALFVDNCFRKYRQAIIEPGTAVGVICGQSIGEPATQMTLKTFHFAGVGSMNIIQGVPRMQEIINGVEHIKTPISTIYPVDDTSSELTKQIQKEIQPIFLRDLITESRTVLCCSGKFFEVVLSPKKVGDLGITHVLLLNALSKVVLKHLSIDVVFKDNGRVYLRVLSDEDFNCQMVLSVLERVQVYGIKNVKRTVIQQDAQRRLTIFMEGGDLIDALQIHGVDTTRSFTNDIIAIMNVLGIEAAHNAIINEFNAVMAAHSLMTDIRHVLLLADSMCHSGQVLGYQRSGMAKSKNSVLCLASFERTLDHLFEAAYHNQKDEINGVSDCITFGKTIPLGTGLPRILWDKKAQNIDEECKERPFLGC